MYPKKLKQLKYGDYFIYFSSPLRIMSDVWIRDELRSDGKISCYTFNGLWYGKFKPNKIVFKITKNELKKYETPGTNLQ